MISVEVSQKYNRPFIEGQFCTVAASSEAVATQVGGVEV